MSMTSPMVRIYVLLAYGVVSAVLAVVFWSGILDIDIDQQLVALALGFFALVDAALIWLFWRQLDRR